ncbi:MAG: class I SAM-dependent methyltransferase [Lentisphaerae bacterium]|nr:class I SAM-dependent methyltransferase [Lentisphaerota bacterium]
MPREMAIAGTHDFVLDTLTRDALLRPGRRVLDVGAGAGALSERLRDAGLEVAACDVAPDAFLAPGIVCRPIAGDGRLPYESGAFDLVLAVEVLEHVDGHLRCFAEMARVLAPGGHLLFTTPNILSLKSRLRFLLTGCFYSFGPLEPATRDPAAQHISPFGLNRYAWALSQHGLHIVRTATDRLQTTSLSLAWLVPLIRLAVRRHPLHRAQNSATLLFGRKLAVLAQKR